MVLKKAIKGFQGYFKRVFKNTLEIYFENVLNGTYKDSKGKLI